MARKKVKYNVSMEKLIFISLALTIFVFVFSSNAPTGLSSVGIFAGEAEYSNNFDSETINQLPAGWSQTYNYPPTRLRVESDPDEPGNVFHLQRNDYSSRYARQTTFKNFNTYYRYFDFELEQLYADYDRAGYAFVTFIAPNGTGLHQVRIYWDYGGTYTPPRNTRILTIIDKNNEVLKVENNCQCSSCGTQQPEEYDLSADISRAINNNPNIDLNTLLPQTATYRYGFYQEAGPGWCRWNNVLIDDLHLYNTVTPSEQLPITDSTQYISSGAYGSTGTLKEYTISIPEATTIQISYNYKYIANTNGRTAYIYTYVNNELVNTLSFRTPKGSWTTTPKEILGINVSAGTLKVRFDYKNGDWRVGMKDVAINEEVQAPPLVNQPPVADAGLNKSCVVQQSCSFNGSGSYDPDGSLVSSLWDFGDGGTSEEISTEHEYNSTGNYTVTLIVTDSEGATSADTIQVTITEEETLLEEIIAYAGPDQICQVSQICTLDGSGSTIQGVDSYTILWDFGDGELFTSQYSFDLTRTHIYTSKGNYTAILNITSGELSSSDTANIEVMGEVAPITEIQCNETDEGKNLEIKGTSTVHNGTETVEHYTDYCNNTSFIVEYWCVNNSTIMNSTGHCSWGCENGACKPALMSPPAELVDDLIGGVGSFSETLESTYLDLHAYYTLNGVENHAGMNYDTGEYECPGDAYCSGDDHLSEWILVPTDSEVEYKVANVQVAEFLEENPEALQDINRTQEYNFTLVSYDSEEAEFSSSAPIESTITSIDVSEDESVEEGNLTLTEVTHSPITGEVIRSEVIEEIAIEEIMATKEFKYIYFIPVALIVLGLIGISLVYSKGLLSGGEKPGAKPIKAKLKKPAVKKLEKAPALTAEERELRSFIKSELKSGRTKKEIRTELLEVGWDEALIDKLLD